MSVFHAERISRQSIPQATTPSWKLKKTFATWFLVVVLLGVEFAFLGYVVMHGPTDQTYPA